MKKIIFSLLILLSVVNVYAKESLFEITDDNAPLYYWNLKKSVPIQEFFDRYIPADCFIEITENAGTPNCYLQSIDTNTDYCYLNIDYLIPKDTDDLIPVEAQTKPNDEYVWMADYYLEMVTKHNINVLKKYEPIKIHNMSETETSYEEWRNYILSNLIVTNCVIKFNLCTFYVENINIIDNGFKIETAVYELDEDIVANTKKSISSTDKHVLYFIYDGDYLNVYIDNMETKFITFVRITVENYENLRGYLIGEIPYLYEEGFTWPHHADGTSEYETAVREPSFKYPEVKPKQKKDNQKKTENRKKKNK